MAAISYWFLSPSVILSLLGKLKGWDRTKPTPAFDWRTAQVDVVIPAWNEEATIALCLDSLFRQDFPLHKVTVIDDGSSDRTAQVVRQYLERTGNRAELVSRPESLGKTPGVREQCENSSADALLILDADTVLTDSNYVSRLLENLFKNAGVASACGNVVPLTRRRRRALAEASPVLSRIQADLGATPEVHPSRLTALLEYLTVIYRTSLYVFLQRVVYDGQMKLIGSRLNPTGCAVAYRTQRLRECFAFAKPQMGDNLSNSEDIFIGHYFSWKGWRNIQVDGVHCESSEPTVVRLPKQLYMWSSSFLQTIHYFGDLPKSPFKEIKNWVAGLFAPGRNAKPVIHHERRIQEQYRAPWGEDFTRRFGRPIGWLDVLSLFEKVSYPWLLLYFAFFNHHAFWITIGLEATVATTGTLIIAERGTRVRSATMMLAATPIRLLTLGVDLVATLQYLLDMLTGNREWRK